MPTNFPTRSLLVHAAALALAGSAIAQTPPTSSTTRSTSPSPARSSTTIPVGTDSRLEIWPESRPILEREHASLRDMASMQGTITSKWEMLTEGQPAINLSYATDFAVAKPDKLYLKVAAVTAYFDGRTLTIHAPALKQYIQTQAAVWNLRDLIEELSSGQIRSLPGEPLLRPGMSAEQTLRQVKSVERVRAGDLDNRPGLWVSGSAVDDRQPSAVPYTYERWFSTADGLTYELRQDFTRMYQEMAGRQHAEATEGEATPRPLAQIVSARWATSYTRRVNQPIAPETFAFTPGPDDLRVDRLLFPRPNLQKQIDLIGKPAPSLENAASLDGAKLDPASLKDKVILLDFWATWCGPCVQAMPQIELIRQRLGDKPLVVLGVNRDAPGASGKVRRFLSKRRFTMGQIDDSAGALAAAFGVSGIPCTVLIGQDGTVLDIDVGYLPGKEIELTGKVERALAGQALRTPEQMDVLRRQAALVAQPAPPAPPAPPVPADP